jgi:hypothetical protein
MENNSVCTIRLTELAAPRTGLAKVAIQFSASTFVVKIATFAKPKTIVAL